MTTPAPGTAAGRQAKQLIDIDVLEYHRLLTPEQ